MTTPSRFCKHYSFSFNFETDKPAGAECANGCDLSGENYKADLKKCQPLDGILDDPCLLRDDWTAAEIEAYEQECARSSALADQAWDTVPDEGSEGQFPCPKCGGTIDWSRSSINGHVWIGCQTPECIMVIQ